MTLPDTLQQAINARIASELKPVADKLLKLKSSIDAYSDAAKRDVERRVSNSVLVALGQETVVEDPKLAAITKDLRETLAVVTELVSLPFVETRAAPPIPKPARPSTPEPPISVVRVSVAPSSAPKPYKPTSPGDVAWAKRLIAEVEALKADIANQHKTRLLPLLRALIADVRTLLSHLGSDQEFLAKRVDALIPILTNIRIEGGVEDFIHGLTYGATGDWERISYKNRKKVAQYDNDEKHAVHASASALEHKAKPGPKPVEPLTNHEWPALPRLHGLTKPILLAGGLLIQEKLKSVQNRFGLDVEWHEIDHDNPRASQTLMSRIRTGKVGAIILLEGVMRHSTYKPVVEACNLNRVPYAMGDKAGIASLHGAFAELERKLAV
jgi:hypothetical protein